MAQRRNKYEPHPQEDIGNEIKVIHQPLYEEVDFELGGKEINQNLFH